MRLKVALGSILVMFCIALLVLFSRTISKNIVNLFFDSPEVDKAKLLGQMKTSAGEATFQRMNEVDARSLTKQTDIQHLDRIKTTNNGRVILQLRGDWSIELLESSSVIAESYRPEDLTAPILMSLSYGDYQVLNIGAPGQLYVAAKGEILSPGTRPVSGPHQIILHPNPIGSSEEDNPSAKASISGDSPLEVEPTTKKLGSMPDKINYEHEETLSSPYIESVLNGLSLDFRRCQMNSVRDKMTSEGFMLLSVTISGNGHARDIKVLQNDTGSENLAACVVAVVERASFRTFKGLPITLTYPLEFK